jgi:putative hemolysin
MLVTLLIFLVLLFLSGFFSSAEIAMMSLTKLQIERMQKRGKKNAKLLAKLKENPHKLLETILIGNNLVNIGAASFATAVSIQLFGDTGVGIATGVTTFLVLLFGEIVPKSLAVNHRKSISLAITPILYALQYILTPVIIVIDWIASIFTKMFGEPEPERVTEEEVVDIIHASEQDGHIKKREREMIQGVLDLDDTNVEEIMTPRLDVFSLEMHRTIGEVIDEVLESGFSRIPVYNRSQDEIKGVVLVKDLLKALKDERGELLLEAVAQDVLFVPANKKLDSVLREFQKKKSPFAMVVDEHGLVIGLLSIEDVLEELVGEIYDENDPQDDAVIQKIDKHSFIIPGKLLIADLNDELGLKLPESEDYDTLAGLVMGKLGRIPKPGAVVKVAQWKLTVKNVTHHQNCQFARREDEKIGIAYKREPKRSLTRSLRLSS